MPITLYDMSVPLLIRGMERLAVLLKKGEDHVDASQTPQSQLLSAQLHPDMKTLAYQVQSCSNVAKATGPRLANQEAIVMEDNEETFEQLYERIERTIGILKEVKREEMEGAEDRPTEMPIATSKIKFETGLEYVQRYCLPRFYMHYASAYAILKREGAGVGMPDYFGPVGDFKG